MNNITDVENVTDEVLLERYSYLSEYIHANGWEKNVERFEEELNMISDELDKRDG